MYSGIEEAKQVLVDYRADSGGSSTPDGTVAMAGNKAGAEMRARQTERLWRRLEAKKLHGVHARVLRQASTDRARSVVEGKLQAETEALIVAAQDGVVRTNVYRAKILKEPGASPKCRGCEREESLAHVLSKCPVQRVLYDSRHDKVLYLLAKEVFTALKVPIPSNMTAPGGEMKRGVVSRKGLKILVDQSIPTTSAGGQTCWCE